MAQLKSLKNKVCFNGKSCLHYKRCLSLIACMADNMGIKAFILVGFQNEGMLHGSLSLESVLG